MKLILK
jgi:hypothetical protein